jgi:hypothetical protein
MFVAYYFSFVFLCAFIFVLWEGNVRTLNLI